MTDTTQPREQAAMPTTIWRIRFPDGSVATLEGEPADYMKPYATAYHIPRQVAPEAPTCTGCDPAEGFCRACRDAEQRSIAATTAGAPPTDFTIVDGGRTIVTGLLGSSNRDEPVRIFKEVIPASASSGLRCYECNEHILRHAWNCSLHIDNRATAPSRNAAPLDDATAFDAAIQSGALIWDHKATARAIAYEGFKAGRAALAQQSAAQAAHAGADTEQCKFPTCQSDECQQMLTEQIKRELYSGLPTDELVSAVRKLVKAKGRFHTEQNYKALADALSNYDAQGATGKKEQK